MHPILSENLNLQIASNFILHKFGDSLFMYDIQHDYTEAIFRSVMADIMLAINHEHQVKSVWNVLKQEYGLLDTDEEARTLFFTFLQNLINRDVLIEGRCDAPALGIKGKSFPIMIALELTNRCNLKCSHCYKEAQIDNDVYLSTELALKILRQIQGNVWHLEFTGGEATLHPDFEKIVTAANVPSMSLLTNGSNLLNVPAKILKRFDIVQVTLYGSSQEEYKKYTEVPAFEKVCAGIKKLVDLNVPCHIAIILRKTNISLLYEYVHLIKELGVTDVSFGYSEKVGRNSEGISDWDLEYEDCSKFDNILRELIDDYPDIHFSEVAWKYYFTKNFPEKDSYKIGCDAGTKRIVVSERGLVRPCVFMPSRYFEKASWDEYYNIIEDGKILDTTSCIKSCLEDFRKAGKSISQICPRAFI